MTGPHIQPRFRTFTDKLLMGTLGTSLRTIRDEDGVTNADLARELGRSKASMERYIAGDRAMPFPIFVRGCQAWDGRFADGCFAFAGMRLVPIESTGSTAPHILADVCLLAAQLATALQDGIVDDAERARLMPLIRHLLAELGELHRLSATPTPAPDTS